LAPLLLIHMGMKSLSTTSAPFSGKLAVLLLACAIGIPVFAFAQDKQTTTNSQNTPPTAEQEQYSSTVNVPKPKEGFWGHMNPWASKKYVRKQTEPINDRLSELDELNGKNARDIQDVDSRSQAGIRRAQARADEANQLATTAGTQAQQANSTAQNASGHVNQLNSTVNGLDQYHPVTEADVKFRSGQPVLSAAARKQLDDLASTVAGQQGYILEMEAHSPLSGSAGIQSSERMAEAVKRYLVSKHEIPVYRLHAVALGNARSEVAEDSKPVRISSVHIRLMENSLAAKGDASPQSANSLTDTERP
jgi:outer membrane protein OmpA-like peptidoglycan-associated protein